MNITTRLSSRFFSWSAMGCGLALGAVLAGCADELPARDLGRTSGLLVEDGGAPDLSVERQPVIAADGAIDRFVAGRWVGQAEDVLAATTADGQRPTYAFPSGATEIVLDLSFDEFGSIAGQLVFGSGTLPEPEVGVPFPSGFDYYTALVASSFSSVGTNRTRLPPIEGFSYPLAEGIARLAPFDGSGNQASAATALPMGFNQSAAFDDWCGLQPSLNLGDFGFNCIDSGGFGGGNPATGEPCINYRIDGTEEVIDCNLLAMCQRDNGICNCTSDGCYGDGELSSHLWLIREGDDLIGNFADTVFDYGTPGRFLPVGAVRFRRVEP